MTEARGACSVACMDNTTDTPTPYVVSLSDGRFLVALDDLIIGFVAVTPLGFNAANAEGTRARPGIPTLNKAVEALVDEHQSNL